MQSSGDGESFVFVLAINPRGYVNDGQRIRFLSGFGSHLSGCALNGAYLSFPDAPISYRLQRKSQK